MGTFAYIGLGSNMGDRKTILDAAVAALSSTSGIASVSASSYHETPPVGGPSGQGPFLNAAAGLHTSLSPSELHNVLKQIEDDAGRIRKVRWGERTLDLDLLLFGDEIVETKTLTIPHCRMAVRRFVLAPLAEIGPSAVEPRTGQTISQLLANLDRRPSSVALEALRDESVFEHLVQKLDVVRWRPGDTYPTSEEDRWIVIEAWIPEIPRPTFVVSSNVRTDRFPREIPVVRVDLSDSEALLAEVVALCGSTRAAAASRDATVRFPNHPL